MNRVTLLYAGALCCLLMLVSLRGFAAPPTNVRPLTPANYLDMHNYDVDEVRTILEQDRDNPSCPVSDYLMYSSTDGTERTRFQGIFTAIESTVRLGVFSDDGVTVYVNHISNGDLSNLTLVPLTLTRYEQPQALPNIEASHGAGMSFHEINATFDAGQEYLITIDYSNICYIDCHDIDGMSVIGYEGKGQFEQPLTVNLFQITNDLTTSVTGGEKIDAQVGGNSVLLRVKVQHGGGVTLDPDPTHNAVTVLATEQATAGYTGALQTLTIVGFSLVSSTTAGSGATAITTEVWERKIDTRSDYNTVDPLTRASSVFTAQMFNAGYNLKPIVKYTPLNGTLQSSDCSSPVVEVQEKTTNVRNINISDVSTNITTDNDSKAQFGIYNPLSTIGNYHTLPINFTLNNVCTGHQYKWEVFTWPTKRSNIPFGYITDIVSGIDPSGICSVPIKATWEGNLYDNTSVQIFDYGTYTFDICVTDLTSNDSQWYKSMSGSFLSDSIKANDNNNYTVTYSIQNSNYFLTPMIKVLRDDVEPVLQSIPIDCSTDGTNNISFTVAGIDDSTSSTRCILIATGAIVQYTRDHSTRPLNCINGVMNDTYLAYNTGPNNFPLNFDTIDTITQFILNRDETTGKDGINVKSVIINNRPNTTTPEQKWNYVCSHCQVYGNRYNRNVIMKGHGNFSCIEVSSYSSTQPFTWFGSKIISSNDRDYNFQNGTDNFGTNILFLHSCHCGEPYGFATFIADETSINTVIASPDEMANYRDFLDKQNVLLPYTVGLDVFYQLFFENSIDGKDSSHVLQKTKLDYEKALDTNAITFKNYKGSFPYNLETFIWGQDIVDEHNDGYDGFSKYTIFGITNNMVIQCWCK